MFALNDDQRDAIDKALTWYFTISYQRNFFVIGGYAGTGKSTIIERLIRVLGVQKYNILFSAFTGKATSILRTKGHLAHTIHKTFYQIFINANGKVAFKPKKKIGDNIKIIVIDEVSMINDVMVNHILSFGIPCIFLGDPGQLPPIFGANRFMDPENDLIDVFLKKVVRASDESGILTLATLARNKEILKVGTYKQSRVLSSFSDIEDITDYDVVLCWKNSTRRKLNWMIRNELGLETRYPSAYEKIICLVNDYNHKVNYEDIPIYFSNGLNCTTLSGFEKNDNGSIQLRFKPDFISDENDYFDVECSTKPFDKYYDAVEAKSRDTEEDKEGQFVYVDYGYAVTVHKSQGSEWNRVLVIDEYSGNQEEYSRWLYTAITRAKESVDIVKVIT